MFVGSAAFKMSWSHLNIAQPRDGEGAYILILLSCSGEKVGKFSALGNVEHI